MHSTRRGSGKPVLLVHGLGSSSGNWAPVIPALAAEREVIAVDLPGCGESAPLMGETTVATLTSALEDFIRDAGLGDVDVVGSSVGARIAMEIARRGHAGNTVALAPGGLWTDRQAVIFGASIKASTTDCLNQAGIRHLARPATNLPPRR